MNAPNNPTAVGCVFAHRAFFVCIMSTLTIFDGSGQLLGRRQAARHQVLILAYVGSNPTAPAIYFIAGVSR